MAVSKMEKLTTDAMEKNLRPSGNDVYTNSKSVRGHKDRAQLP